MVLTRIRIILTTQLICFIVVPCTSVIVSTNPDDVHFFLYPNHRSPDPQGYKKSEEIIFNSTTQILPARWNPNAPTFIYTHGFITPQIMVHYNRLIQEYLNLPFYVNVVIVDWTKLSNPFGLLFLDLIAGYPEVVLKNVPKVGERLGDFVLWLLFNNLIFLDRLHLGGHSLGSHICGYAGACVITVTEGQKIGRISAFDPAGPLFQAPLKPPEIRRLNPNDAFFVDAIHTNAGFFGTSIPVGHVDIWVNGGKTQKPICLLSIPAPDPVCSHNYATIVYTYSIIKPLKACKSFTRLIPLLPDNVGGNVTMEKDNQRIPQQVVPEIHCNETVELGLYTDTRARGNYDLKTRVVINPFFTGELP